ncbi:MAG: hypothetical protein JWP75_2548 [Frondihabitans sp.]|nr:hypothetical protein [Frondihabitans sp.]
MTYLRPDKKGLGLDVPGPDEPSYFSGQADSGSHRWWMTGRGLASSVVISVVWTGWAVMTLIEVVSSPHTSSSDWLQLILTSVLALASFPSVVIFARSRRPGSTIAPAESSSGPGASD